MTTPHLTFFRTEASIEAYTIKTYNWTNVKV